MFFSMHFYEEVFRAGLLKKITEKRLTNNITNTIIEEFIILEKPEWNK